MGNCFIIDFKNFYLYKIIEDSFFFNYLLNNCTLSLDDLLSKSIDLFEKKLKVIILVISSRNKSKYFKLLYYSQYWFFY